MYLDLESLNGTGDSQLFQHFLIWVQQHLPADVLFNEGGHVVTKTNPLKELAHMVRGAILCTLLQSLCV